MKVEQLGTEPLFAQRLLTWFGFPLTADGDWGPKSQAALEKHIAASADHPEFALLHPKLQPLMALFHGNLLGEASKHALKVTVVSTLRSYGEQDAIYAQGRTKPGAIVTRARGGSSMHQFGLATDFALLKNGKWLKDNPTWKKIFKAALAKSPGLDYGGDWASFQDLPHVQLKGLPGGVAVRAKFEQNIACPWAQ